MSNKTIKTINFQNTYVDGSLKKSAEVLLESVYHGSSEGKYGVCHTTVISLRPDPETYNNNKVSVVQRDITNPDEVLQYRLFFNADHVTEKIKLSELLIKHLDDYDTIWKDNFVSFIKTNGKVAPYEEQINMVFDPVLNIHECFWIDLHDTESDIYVKVVTNHLGEIIGYLIKTEDCDESDSAVFLFKNKELCSETLLNFMQQCIVSMLDGGRQLTLRDIFTFTDSEIKDYINDDAFTVYKNYLFHVHTSPKDKDQINNNLNIN